MLVGFWFLMSHARAKDRRYDVMLIFWHAVGSVDWLRPALATTCKGNAKIT